MRQIEQNTIQKYHFIFRPMHCWSISDNEKWKIKARRNIWFEALKFDMLAFPLATSWRKFDQKSLNDPIPKTFEGNNFWIFC